MEAAMAIEQYPCGMRRIAYGTVLTTHKWPSGGIGRRARLKIWCPQGRVGSIPTLATK